MYFTAIKKEGLGRLPSLESTSVCVKGISLWVTFYNKTPSIPIYFILKIFSEFTSYKTENTNTITAESRVFLATLGYMNYLKPSNTNCLNKGCICNKILLCLIILIKMGNTCAVLINCALIISVMIAKFENLIK